MEKDVCGEITKSDSGQKVIAEYYRLTLFYGDPVYHTKFLLQSSIAKASEEALSCKVPHPILAGRQAVREL